MEIDVMADLTIRLRKVYSGVMLEADPGETFGICMRDGGFEFNYNGVHYRAIRGKVELMSDVCKEGGQ